MQETNHPAQSANRQIARAAGIIMLAFVFSNLLGLVRGMVITQAFGTSADYDSFNAANRITELLFNLIAGGALGSAFIPTFTGMLTKGDQKNAWRLASSVANILFVVMFGICILAFVFAPQIVRHGLYLLAPDANPGQLDLTVHLLRLMLPTVIIFAISGLLMGILNAHQVFLIPALTPAMYSLGMILGTLFLPQSWGIARLAVGTVLGALLHLAIQLPGLQRLPKRAYHFILDFKDKAVRQVMLLMGPRILGVAVVQVNFVVNTIIALSLPQGSASAVAVAFALMMMPLHAIAQSAATASLPTFSAQVALNKLDEMRSSLASTLRVVLFLAIPATLGMILLRVPLVQALYQRGNFTAESTQMVAWALLWYTAGLVGHSLVEILSRAFYAMYDTRTPVTVGVIVMAANIGLSFAFAALFTQWGWLPHGGLALANSLVTAVESVVLLMIMRKRLNGLEGKKLWQGVGVALLGTGLMSAAILLWMKFFAASGALVVLAGALLVGVVVYALVMWLFKVPELRSVLNLVLAKLRRKG